MPDLITRLSTKFEVAASGCWIWTAAKRPGRGSVHGAVQTGSARDGSRRMAQAHRAAWEAVVEPIGDGEELDHLCKNGLCINPDHLEPVTPRENKVRGDGWAGINARRVECSKGHRYTPENTRIDRRGHRICRTCNGWTDHARAAAVPVTGEEGL